jgi:hypothetical protein
MRGLLRFWFTFEEAVGRRDYLRHGVGLMALKYAGDLAIVWIASHTLWTPVDYLRSVPGLMSLTTASPPYLATALALWTLPFLWIGVSMTIRRLLDAGRSAWWSLLFFVPPISYALMIALVLMPAAGNATDTSRPDPSGRLLPSALLSIAVAAAVGLAMISLSVRVMNSYGLALFLGTPFVLGLATAFTLCRRYPASRKETSEVVAFAGLVVAGATLLVGNEGAVCLLMLAPLGLVIALMGGATGRHFANIGEGPARGAVLIAVMLPGGAALESGQPMAHVREVRSSVVIDAPAMEVWNHVIAFDPIPEPTSPMFKLGIAYPMHAEIDGSGVGAVRYCVFSTGAFVEPITAWEPGERLSFDVVESPPPLEELSLWRIAPPHLTGYLEPVRGEFRLIRLPGGATRLEGSTWYEQRLRPEGYWVLFSDLVIRRIHVRVLEHIRLEVESARPESRVGP